MEIISEMISVEKIKPASPTPHHLRIYKISLLDQMMPCIYIPLLLYFSGDGNGNGNGDGIIQLLKESLSQTLATFYPFAGVIRDALSADCNDDGLPFSVAKVKGQIRDFLQNPNFEMINKFLPGEYNPEKPLGHGDSVMLIQLNFFDCGSIAISILFAHLFADLASISTFLRSWAAHARGGGLGFAELNCIIQSSFPQKPSLPTRLTPSYTLAKFRSLGNFVTRRYVFDASDLSTLKAAAGGGAAPSRVDVVTAVIWKCFMAAVAAELDSAAKPFVMTQAVNLRRLAAPPLAADSFGNFVWKAAAVCGSHEGNSKELREVVWEVKKGRARINEEFVRRLEAKEDDDLYEYLEGLKNEMPEEGEWISFSSWANMGLYEVDFGWGKPVWVSGAVSRLSKMKTRVPTVATLMDTNGGDGMEAWMILDRKYVARFEKNDDILKYARINPSVL